MADDDRDSWLPELAGPRAVMAAAEAPMTAAVRSAMGHYLGLVSAAVLRHDTSAVLAAASDLPPSLDAWPPPSAWDGALTQFVLPVAARTWRAAWSDVLTAEQFAVLSDETPLARHLADTTTRLTAAAWPDELYEAVRALVVAFIAADGDHAQLRRDIATVLGLDAWDARVRTIARTEVAAAYSAASYQAGVSRADVLGDQLVKVWLATNDARTRPEHVRADGAVTELDEPFSIGGEALRFPHDPLGSARNTVNCRCVLLWLDEDDAAAARAEYQQYLQGLTRSETEEGVAVTTATATVMAAEDGDPDTTDAPAQETTDGDGAPGAVYWSGPLMALEHRTGDSCLIQRVMGVPTEGYRATSHPWLSYQRASQPGHAGKVSVGRPEALWVADAELDGAQVLHVWGAGSFDVNDPDGAEAVRKVTDGYAGTVSADLDDAQAELRWVDEAGKQVDEPDDDEFWAWLEGEDIGKSPIEYYHAWRFAGVTMVQDPAFHTGWLQITETPPTQLGTDNDAFWTLDVAALTASAAPLASVQVIGAPGSTQWCQAVAARAASAPVATADLFANPRLTGPTKITVGDDGLHVYGHVADWNTVHAVFGVPPPRCPSGGAYPRFHRHPVPTADGGVVLTGPLTGNGHASTAEDVSVAAATLHYDDPRHVLADVVAGEDEWGIWVSGALRAGVSAAGVLFLHRYSFSGDWRDEQMIAACACSTPAFHLRHDPAVVSLVASAGAQRPKLAGSRARLRRRGDGSIAALLSVGVIGAGPTGVRAGARGTRSKGDAGWTLYREFQAAAALDARVSDAARRVRAGT